MEEAVPKQSIAFNQKFGDTIKYDSYCNGVKYLTNVYPGILEVCYMFAKNLIYLHEILKEEEDNDERCRYFNFWITDHVKKKLKTEWNDHRYITSILSGFYGVENLIRASTHNNNCHFDYKRYYCPFRQEYPYDKGD
ncbi:PIR Superfamily Protein [Plasmodium ovale wallikeri]|uniref:PIR Superfamily Protein n=1 Tax=Plasmodium ovale wallikeri TaxID=864142 RepID=A0A1A9AGB2_PLAOA|nr:PIR Superfamily Protein [Plasmodium ovale wallikeri]